VRELAQLLLQAKADSVLVAESAAEPKALRGAFRQVTSAVDRCDDARDQWARTRAEGHRAIAENTVLYMSGYTDNVIADGGMLSRELHPARSRFTPPVLAQKIREVLDAPVTIKPN